ncbi:MAG: nuclear transport factor 2 family protein [Gemmatimonadetes bacterium]|nr:nuclear transport factor 2 family protein [Gemmatimonadota bacterium]
MQKVVPSLALAALLLPVGSAGQTAPRPEDVSTLDGIIRAYYEVVSGPAGEAADADRDRTLHHPEAWIAIAGANAEGRPVVDVMTLDQYHENSGVRSEGFYEWETDRITRRSGNMVSVWSSYAAARTSGGEPFTRGVNTITLFHDGERWWIMNWMFDASAG